MNHRVSIATAVVTMAALLNATLPAQAAKPGRRDPQHTPRDRGQRGTASAQDVFTRAGAPEIAFQFMPCLNDEQRRKVTRTLKAALRAASKGAPAEPDVRSRCSAELLGTESFGVWRRPAVRAYPPGPDPVLVAARNTALQQMVLLRGLETFAGRVSYGMLNDLATQAWEAQPKRRNEQGDEDDHGPIHLRSFSFAFAGGDTIRTRVRGAYSKGPIVADFVYTLVDTVSIERGALRARSRESLDVDETPVTLAMLGLGAVFLPLGVFGLKGLVEVWEQEANPPDPGTNVGAMIVQMFPAQLMVTGGQKVVFNYERIRLAPKAPVEVGGTYALTARDPRVTIEGPRDVWTFLGDAPHQIVYKAITQDLRPGLAGAWTLDGEATDPPPARGARLAPPVPDVVPTAEAIRFEPPRIATGHFVTRRVAVAITDTDDLIGRAAIDVRVHLDDRRRPAICREKPSLPQCRREPRRE
jgi:hypothetical protein